MPEPFPQSAEGTRIRLRAALEACVQSGRISERERVVVAMRLALADGRWHTLAVTGSVIGGAGKERVRQMQNRAIWKLRRCAEMDELLQPTCGRSLFHARFRDAHPGSRRIACCKQWQPSKELKRIAGNKPTR